MAHRCDRFHVITGGPGSGKTTLIDALAATGVTTSAEVGRAVIRDQIASGGSALPWDDAAAFAAAMAEREIAAYHAASAHERPVVFDRGIPDVVGFLRVMGLAVPAAIDAAARQWRYNSRVFIAPFWAAVYTTDPERRQPAALAEETYATMERTYADYGYESVPLPLTDVPGRVAFVRARIG